MNSRRSSIQISALIPCLAITVAALVYSGCNGQNSTPPKAASSNSAPQTSAPASSASGSDAGQPAMNTMDVAQAVMVTVELDFGAQLPTVENAMRQIERLYRPDDGSARTFAILDADGWKTAEGRLHLQMHVSSERPGLGSLVFKPTGEVLWRTRINPTTMPQQEKRLTVLIDNGSGKTLLIDGSNNPSSILAANIKELGKPVQDNWADGSDREFTFTYSACGCPVKAMVKRVGNRTARVASKRLDGSVRDPDLPVLFPDDPGAVAVISKLMQW